METLILVLAIGCVAAQLLLIALALFGPGLAYRIEQPPSLVPESQDFARVLGALSDAEPHPGTLVEVLTNGEAFYEAELAAIAGAQSHICLEGFIFQPGRIGGRFIGAMAERAAAGVQVRLVMDAAGSVTTRKRSFRKLIEAGGEVRFYMPLRWYNLTHLNHRTHRELLVVDGRVGFIGGAGVADHWLQAHRGRARWRDTMFRVEGRAVASLQSMFAENWLESSGELLTGVKYYPPLEARGGALALVISSTPSMGRATHARMVFQTLIAAARRAIHITTPYFVPDFSLRRELIRAMEERGVEVKIIVPGTHNNHLLTRRSSRRLYGDLLRHGAQIYEYQPAMMHVKSLVVDGVWSVVGSTNFDHRSFGLNDEANLAALDEGLATRLERDFQSDLAEAHRVTYAEWLHRPVYERVHEWLGWIIERQE